jgi:hypothetical protein
MDELLLRQLQQQISNLESIILGVKTKIEEQLPNVVPIKRYYTPQQVCDLLQINKDTLIRMRKDGRIEYKELGNLNYRYPANQPLLTKAEERQKTILESRKEKRRLFGENYF